VLKLTPTYGNIILYLELHFLCTLIIAKKKVLERIGNH
jgi:hypothetical protein